MASLAKTLKRHSSTVLPLSVVILGFLLLFAQKKQEPGFFSQSSVDEVLRVVIAGSPHESDHLPFDWAVYKDPSRPEFWADGEDGIMPRPFLHLAAEPTVENARQLLAWKKRQWEAVEAVIKALGAASELELYSEVIGQDFIDFAASKDPLVRMASNLAGEKSSSIVDWTELKVVYLYRSSCPYCKDSVPFIDGLKDLGADVLTFQVDHAELHPLHSGSKPYSKEVSKFFPLGEGSATPTFYFRYRGESFSQTGTLSLAALTKHLRERGGNDVH